MPETPKPLSITPTDFLGTLSRYDAFTSSPSQITRQATEPRVDSEPAGRPALESLKELDTWRTSTLPDTIAARRKEGCAYISHDELVNLMKCKLKRGKFRPQLLPQVVSNNPSTVEKITAKAFEFNKDLKGDEKPDLENVKSALAHLSKNLKGVGPATASYILAAQIPHWIPAFSDESFRWAFFNKHMPGVIEGTAASTTGWHRPIKYSLKEYYAYVEEVWSISDRLIAEYKHDGKPESESEKSARALFGAGSIEMVGWVFGKDAAGWLPREPEHTENGRERESTQTKHDTPKEGMYGKRKHHGGPETKVDLDVDPQNPKVAQDQGSTGPGESKPRKFKKTDTGESVSNPKKRQRVTSGNRTSDSSGLRRSSRNRKADT